MAIGALAAQLDLERTSLGRILRPLVERGWLVIEPGADRRQRIVSLTEKGSAVAAAAHAHWRGAQQEIRQVLGAAESATLLDMLTDTREALKEVDL